MAESEHDVWETGHSSTSLSAAMGMAIARDLKGESSCIIPIIGDGALTGGMALEALNHIGHEKKKLIVILNDNEMSIAPNVGAMHNMLGRLRTAGKYHWVKDELEYLLKKIPAIGGQLAATAERIKDSLKYLFVSGIFFEELGFTYLGPVDGHDYDALFENLAYAKKQEGPVLLHVITKKGKGYNPAESDKIGTWHGTGPYKMETGDFVKPDLSPPAWSKLVSETVRKMAREDERIVAVTPAMPVGSKLEGFASEFPDRMIDVGIAEQHAATFAAGLATQKMKPFLAIYSTFLQRAYDQVVHDVCLQNLPVTFVMDRAGIVGEDGPTHHGVFDVSFLRPIPNVVLASPKDGAEFVLLLKAALRSNRPFFIRIPKAKTPDRPNGTHLQKEGIPVGCWEVLQAGHGLALFGAGRSVEVMRNVAIRLQKFGLSPILVNARFLKPYDESCLRELTGCTSAWVSLDDGVKAGGLGTLLAEYLADSCLRSVSLLRLGIEDRFVPHGSLEDLERALGLEDSLKINQNLI